MKRRTFLVTLGGAVAAAGGLTLVMRRMGDSRGPALTTVNCPDSGPLELHLRDFFADPESVRPLGRRVLSGARVRPSVQELVARVFRGDQWPTACRLGPRTVLQQQIRADFATGNVVTVDGWILSRTETDLCALAELASSS
ncbi:MAG: hypothetical protein DHS20C21_09000 [Gemmatimonadota bacterium]|nr:MAG: hypothetical protein DHS20C21_09000 [Gemmatimonadota bacterium]